jgi:hypothetical protein
MTARTFIDLSDLALMSVVRYLRQNSALVVANMPNFIRVTLARQTIRGFESSRRFSLSFQKRRIRKLHFTDTQPWRLGATASRPDIEMIPRLYSSYREIPASSAIRAQPRSHVEADTKRLNAVGNGRFHLPVKIKEDHRSW